MTGLSFARFFVVLFVIHTLTAVFKLLSISIS